MHWKILSIGATAEDIDQENAARILEKEVLSDCELLGKAAPLVLYVLQRERMNKFSPAVLTAASLALSKLMLLRSEDDLDTFSYSMLEIHVIEAFICKLNRTVSIATLYSLLPLK